MHRRLLQVSLFALLILLVGPRARAAHIIGGVMSYECLGNDEYRFTLKMYRDCNCTNCAPFDEIAPIAVYRCDGNGNCEGPGQQAPFQTANVPIGSITEVDPPTYPCLIPPDVCVQEGIYTFQLRLPRSDKSYVISYQRCCRNQTISNIISPGSSGATFSIELTPHAQEVCNNSPTFDSYPPSILCNNQFFEYDHSATDKDGDQLVYEFCSPILGGGNDLSNAGYTLCTGAAPTPACPPPYDQVIFRGPDFSSGTPMGRTAANTSVIQIDPLTGMITGTPMLQGQFVVGICVSEYRGGQLLSRVIRDFQFNVASCEATVIADIKEAIVTPDQEYVVNSCGDTDISFVNESYLRQFISTFRWEFDIGNGQTAQSNEWEPTITFPGVGEYTGSLYLNEGVDCGDTARIRVNIFPAIDADFSYAYDTCVAGPVQFTDQSTTGSCCMTSWSWDFGDGNTSRLQNPSNTYRQPGQIPVTLTVRDTNQCEGRVTKPLPYFPAPAILVVDPSMAIGCAPTNVFFDNLSTPIDTTYDIQWSFGDGGSSMAISPWYTYQQPGVYTVTLDVTSPIGCRITRTFPDLVTVQPSPEAGFTYTPEELSNLSPEVKFTDQSSGAFRWAWTFGDGQRSTLPSPQHLYRDTGRYEVIQIVTHPSGCMDTAIVLLDVVPEVRYFLPNAFTPNGDSKNDMFLGDGYLIGAEDFQFMIWDRWGEMIFETDNPLEGWNGRRGNSGPEAPAGVYLVQVRYRGPRGEPYHHKGFVTLIR